MAGTVIPLFTGLQDLWAAPQEPRSQLGWRRRRGRALAWKPRSELLRVLELLGERQE